MWVEFPNELLVFLLCCLGDFFVEFVKRFNGEIVQRDIVQVARVELRAIKRPEKVYALLHYVVMHQ